MINEPQERAKADRVYSQVQSRMRTAFAKGSTENIDAQGLTLEHMQKLKAIWGQDFKIQDENIKLRS